MPEPHEVADLPEFSPVHWKVNSSAVQSMGFIEPGLKSFYRVNTITLKCSSLSHEPHSVALVTWLHLFLFIFIRESTAFLFFHNFDSVQRCSLIFSDLVEKRITKFDLQRKNGHFQIWEAYVNLVNQLRINQFSSFLINLLPSPSVLWSFWIERHPLTTTSHMDFCCLSNLTPFDLRNY